MKKGGAWCQEVRVDVSHPHELTCRSASEQVHVGIRISTKLHFRPDVK